MEPSAPPLPEGVQRVAARLAALGHPRGPILLTEAARTAQQAADALGVPLGAIAKSIVFRRLADDAAVLVVSSGDCRVDEQKVAALIGPIGRADAAFVCARTGFAIGGVAPIAHAVEPVTLIDRELFRFAEIWAAAGHPNAVFPASAQALARMTGAPVHDVALAQDRPPELKPWERTPVVSPCVMVCRMDSETGLCRGCYRSIDEIVGWSRASDEERRAVWQQLPARGFQFRE